MTRPKTIAGRLRMQLDINHRSISWLAQRIGAMDLRGGSYGSARSYVSGAQKAAPPLEFLNAAAELLNCRPAWLICGDGESTEELERVRLAGAIDPTFQPTWGGVPRASQSVFADLVDALRLTTDPPAPPSLQLFFAEQIGEIMAAPFGRHGWTDTMEDVPEATLRNYVTALLGALRTIVAEPRSLKLSDLEAARDADDEKKDEAAEPTTLKLVSPKIVAVDELTDAAKQSDEVES